MELNENNYKEFVEKIVGGMDDDERKHLQFITTKLIACYGKDSPFSAVIVFSDSSEGSIALASANANSMLAAELLMVGNEYAQKNMMEGAPPKEMFN